MAKARVIKTTSRTKSRKSSSSKSSARSSGSGSKRCPSCGRYM